MSESLKKKTTKGVLWSAIERFSVQGVQFLVMIVMARLLTPEDYGLIGMLAIFMAVSQTLIDSGFSQALIRKKDRSEVDNSTVFYFNLVVGLLLYLILFIAAPYVATFYETPELTAIMRVICLGVILNSLAVVQRAILTVNIDFKTQAKASAIAAVLSGVVGISMAYAGYGVWSLVGQQLTSLGINSLMLWCYSKWRPSWVYSWTSFRELFSFGSKLLASGILETTYNNIYPIIVGKLFSAASLGHYTRALHFAQFPSANITGILQRVTFPVLCSIQDDDERLSNVYRRFLKLSAYIVFPLMIGLSAVAYPFVILAIGEKWEFCALLLQISCFGLMWYPIHSVNLSLLTVKGRSDLFLRLEIIKKIMGVIVICATAPFGLVAMCYGKIISSLIALIINTHYTGNLIHVGFFRQMQDLFPTLLLSLTMFGGIWFINQFIQQPIYQLIADISYGIMHYIGLSLIFKFSELKEIFSLIKKK